MKHTIWKFDSFKPPMIWRLLPKRSDTSPWLAGLLTLLISFGYTCLSGQTWDGGASSNWGTAANWDPNGLPAGHPDNFTGMTLRINGGASPVLPSPDTIFVGNLDIDSDLTIPAGVTIIVDVSAANTDGVNIASGATLTVDPGGKLVINNSTAQGINVLGDLVANDSIIINGPITMNAINVNFGGTVTVGNTGVLLLSNITDDGITNNGTVINGGQIHICGTMEDGIENQRTFTNNGKIFISNVEEEGLENNGGDFINNEGDTLIIARTTFNGIRHNGNSFDNFGTIIIDSTGMNGILVSTDFNSINDTILIGTNHPLTGTGSGVGNSVIGGDGIRIENNNTVYVIQNNSCITIGDSTIAHVEGSGINLTGSADVDINPSENLNDSTKILITGVTQHGLLLNTEDNRFDNNNGTRLTIFKTGVDGINNSGVIFNKAAFIRIDSVGGDGIDNLPNTPPEVPGTINNIDSSQIEIGLNGGGIMVGIRNEGTINNGSVAENDRGTAIRINAILTSIINLGGSITNGDGLDNDECVLIETNTPTMITGGNIINHDVFITSSSVANTINPSETFLNNGIVIDPNNSFGSELADEDNDGNAREPGPGFNTASNGVVVAPVSQQCFIGAIDDFLVVFDNVFDPATAIYLPSTNFIDPATNAVIGTFNATSNQLTLLQATSSMSLVFDIESNGMSCGLAGLATLSFQNTMDQAVICNARIQVSLDADCQAVLSPDLLLEGNNNCTEGYTVEILSGTRAGTDTLDHTYLGQTVSVMVTSPNGNSCWGDVIVEDKLPPILTCRDTFVYCNQSFDPNILGFPTAADGCGGLVTFTYTDMETGLDACGQNGADQDTIRRIIRLFTGRDQFGNADTCRQTILVLRPTIAQVEFPDSLTDEQALQCNNANTSPDITGRPFVVINNDTVEVDATCKFGVSMEDRTTNLGCPGKERILRTWTVMDWCHLNSGGAIRTYTQLIDVRDTIPPTFDSIRASDIRILTDNSHKCMANIIPPAPQNVEDLCSGTFYRILGPTGNIYNNPLDSLVNVPFGTNTLEYIISDSCGNEVRDTVIFILEDNIPPVALARELSINLVDDLGNTWVYATSFDAGSHDNCGQVDSILIKKPGVDTFATAVAFDCEDIGKIVLTLRVVDSSGLASETSREVLITDKGGFCDNDGDGITTPGEDTNNNGDVTDDDADGDGLPNYLDIDCNVATYAISVSPTDPTDCDSKNGQITITATGTGLEYSIDSGNTFVANNIFSSLDTGTYVVYVRGASPSCQEAYNSNPVEIACVTSFDEATPVANVAGHIRNESGEMIEEVNVKIGGYEMTPQLTGADGSYYFSGIPLAGNYQVTPTKDRNYANGVSTLDIVLLSKHIIGVKNLDSPYKLIAADINRSGTITAYDMVLLRQLILSMSNTFPNNTSWRFIDANYVFKNPTNPFAEDFPEVYEITDLANDMMSLDFIAVKIGDLNGNAIANRFAMGESRSSKSLDFQIAEQIKAAGETLTIDFKSTNFRSILGYQFTLDFDGDALAFENISIGKSAGFENFNLSMVHRGIITSSWNGFMPTDIDSDEVLFSLTFKTKKAVRISEAIHLSSSVTPAEAYEKEGNLVNVQLKIKDIIEQPDGFKLYQNKPNPFTGETVIGFDLPEVSTATLTIFNLAGKQIKSIKDEYQKGYNQIVLNGGSFTEYGVLYYQLSTSAGVETKKMILLKK